MTPVVPMQRSGTVVDARMSLAMWLRAGRSQRAMRIEDVARITKIQVRILERLEAGTIKPGDGMPAEVFVRGFVRSIARCLGLDETEALRRYTEAAAQAALDPSPTTAGPAARAFVESMSELAPQTARTSAPRLLAPEPEPASEPEVVAAPMRATTSEPAGEIVVETVVIPETVEPAVASAIEVVEVAPTDGKKKKSKKGTGKGRGKRKDMATGTPFEPTPVVVAELAATETLAPETVATDLAATEIPALDAQAVGATAVDPIEAAAVQTIASDAVTSEAVATEAPLESQPVEILEPGQTWSPRMPAVAPTVPWRINASAQVARSKATTARIIPSLVIDDAAPDLAERELEDRAASREPARRSFLPPILMDREDRSARQGGLTLAVIILLIAATLTLSYLMRRPSSSGDGVTQAELVESVDQLA